MGKKGETLTAKKPPPAGPVYPKGSMFLLDGAGDSGWNGFYNASGSFSGSHWHPPPPLPPPSLSVCLCLCLCLCLCH